MDNDNGKHKNNKKLYKFMNSILKLYQINYLIEYKIYALIYFIILLTNHFYKRIFININYLTYITFFIFFINLILLHFFLKKLYLIYFKNSNSLSWKNNYFLMLYTKLITMYPFIFSVIINFLFELQIINIIKNKTYLNNALNIIIFVVNNFNLTFNLLIMLFKIFFLFEIIPKNNSLANYFNFLDLNIFLINFLFWFKDFLIYLFFDEQIVKIFVIFFYIIYIKIVININLVYDYNLNFLFYQIFIIYALMIIIDYLNLLILDFKLNNFIIILIPWLFKFNNIFLKRKIFDFINNGNNLNEKNYWDSILYCYEVTVNPRINSKFYLIYNSLLSRHIYNCINKGCICKKWDKSIEKKNLLKNFILTSLLEKIRKGILSNNYYFNSIELLIKNDFKINSSLIIWNLFIKNKFKKSFINNFKLYILTKRIEELVKLNYKEKNIIEEVTFKEKYDKGNKEINNFYKEHLKTGDLLIFKKRYELLKNKINIQIGLILNLHNTINNDKLNLNKFYSFLWKLKKNSDNIHVIYDNLYLKTNKFVCTHLQMMVIYYNFIENRYGSSLELIKKVTNRLILSNRKLFKSNEKIWNYSVFHKSVSFMIGAFKKELGMIKDVFGDIFKYLNYNKEDVVNKNVKEIIFDVIKERHDFLISNFTENMKNGFLGVQRKMVIINKLNEAESIFFCVKLFPIFENNWNYVAFLKFTDSNNKYYILLNDNNNIISFSKSFNNIIDKQYLNHSNLKDICIDLFKDLNNDEEILKKINDLSNPENKKNYYKLFDKKFDNKLYSFEFNSAKNKIILYFNANMKYHYFRYGETVFYYKYLSLKQIKDIETNLITLNPFCEEINYNIEIEDEFKKEEIKEKNKVYNINKKLIVQGTYNEDDNKVLQSSEGIYSYNHQVDENGNKEKKKNNNTASSSNSITLNNNKKLKIIEEIFKKSKVSKIIKFLIIFLISGLFIISLLLILQIIFQKIIFTQLNNNFEFYNYLLKYYQNTQRILKLVLLTTGLQRDVIYNSRYSVYNQSNFFNFAKNNFNRFHNELVIDKKFLINKINSNNNFSIDKFIFDNTISNNLYKNTLNKEFTYSFYFILNNINNFSLYFSQQDQLEKFSYDISNINVYYFVKQITFKVEPFYQNILKDILDMINVSYTYSFNLFFYLFLSTLIICLITMFGSILIYGFILLDLKNWLYIYNKLKQKDIIIKYEELELTKDIIRRFQNIDDNYFLFEKYNQTSNKIDYNKIFKDKQSKKKIIKKNKYYWFDQKAYLILLFFLFSLFMSFIIFFIYYLNLKQIDLTNHIGQSKEWLLSYQTISKLFNEVNNGYFLESINDLSTQEKNFILGNIDEFLKNQNGDLSFKELIFKDDISNNSMFYDIYNKTICGNQRYFTNFTDYCNLLSNTDFKDTSFILLLQNFNYEFNIELKNIRETLSNINQSKEFINSLHFINLEIVYNILDGVYYFIFDDLFRNIKNIENKYILLESNIVYYIISILFIIALIFSLVIYFKIKKLKYELEYIFMTISNISIVNNNPIKLAFLNYFKVKNKRILN